MAEFRIIERDEVGYEHGSGWGLRPLPATECFIHYPGAKQPPPEDATEEEDLAYARYLDEIGYSRFREADFVGGVDAYPGDPGAGISYSLLFPKSGRIIRGHDPARQSSHTKGHNYSGMGYCIWVAEGESPTIAQINAVGWALNEQVRLGELEDNEIDGGHRDVFATICPTDAVMAAIPRMREAAGGTIMAKRRPTRADLNALVANQKERGFEHYCTPYSYDRGICPSHGGNNPHSSDSRHRLGLAVDFGWPGAAISDTERIHVLLEMRRLAADPEIEWRRLFDISNTNHPDHGHVDDMGGVWTSDVRDRFGVFDKDGYTVFVSPKAFPNHIPKTNSGFTLSHIVKFQNLAKRLGKYSGSADGYLGTNTRKAAEAVQKMAGIKVDGLPGAQTIAAAERLLNTPDNFGFSAEHIKLVQQMLTALGYYTDKIDGSHGPNSQQAVYDFQSDFGLTKDKMPGTNTTAVLTRVYKNNEGFTVAYISEIQVDLNTLGFYDGPISGELGPLTREAVTKFQKARGLTADGLPGKNTWNEIDRALEEDDNVPPLPEPTPDPKPTPEPTPEPEPEPELPTQPTLPGLDVEELEVVVTRALENTLPKMRIIVTNEEN